MKKPLIYQQDIDLKNIKDSMQLDSGQVIASLSLDEKTATLEVRGNVKVWWNPDTNAAPEDGEYYIYPSEFPTELKNIISKNKEWYLDDRLYIAENNWFETFVYTDKNDYCPTAYTVDVEGYDESQIFEILLDALKECS